MKKILKRRFIIGAMVSFFILTVLLLSSIVLLIYAQQDRLTDSFLDGLLTDDTTLVQSPPPNWFGYHFTQPTLPAGFYKLEVRRDGTILSVEKNGILQNEEDDLAPLIQTILRSEKLRGKLGAFKYGYIRQEDTIRLVLLDQTLQISSLYDVLRMGIAVGLISMAVLLLILQPIAGRVAEQWLKKTEQQKQFITNARHELKTPVAIIMSNADALELMSGESKYSRNIQQQARRLDCLIKQLMTIVHADELRYHAQKERIDFSELIRDELAAFGESAAAHNMTLKADIEPLCVLKGDREKLRRLVHTLTDNAVQYGQKGGQIEIALSSTRRRILLTLTNPVDTLPACSPQMLFERFYRAGGAKKQNEAGWGVGLSAAESVVRLHKGTCQITYPNEHTFRMSVMLPCEK